MEETAAYEISLPVFEGPMDLLLHLVTKNRIDLHDIPIHEITDQYLDYLERAQKFDLNLGSSFFAMAATLLLIKSRLLLPRRRAEEEDAAEEDPRQELARSLEEFKRMKELRARLEELLAEERPYRRREPMTMTGGAFHGKISIARLTAAFFSILEELPEEETRVVEAEEVTFDSRADALREFLSDGAPHPLTDFFRKQKSRTALAVSLIALLELIRTGEAGIEETAGGIVIMRNSEFGIRN